MKLEEFLERYVFVRKCVGCGKRMGYEQREEAFCTSCRISWERAKADFCPDCSMSITECRCIPKSLSNAGVLDYRKLITYRKGDINKPQGKIIYFLKHNRNKRAALFLARQLLNLIYEIVAANNEDLRDAVLTYIPRSKRSYSQYGVDQAMLVANAVAELSSIECLPLIKRESNNKTEQKSLGIRARVRNVGKAFEVDAKLVSNCQKRTVIIFDDVVTSGASMAKAARLLHRCGVEKVYALSVAYVIKEKR